MLRAMAGQLPFQSARVWKMFLPWTIWTVASFAVLVSGRTVEAGAPDGEDTKEADCKARHERIAKVFRSLPADLHSLSPQAANRLSEKVEEALRDCRDYLRVCKPGEDASTKEERERTGEVHYYQAKFLYLLSARYQIELDARHRRDKEAYPRESLRSDLETYHTAIARSAEKARELLPKESALRPVALQLEGLSWNEARNAAAAERAYSQFLEAYPDHELGAAVLAALGRALISLERYDDGIERLKEGLRETVVDKSSSYPYVIESLWKLHEAKGDPAGMIEVCETIAKLFPYRMSDPSRAEKEREVYGQLLVFNGFRLGYGLCAQGRFQDARSAWETFASELDNQKRTLGSLPPYAEIYLKRARDSLAFLDSKVNQAPPTDLDLIWATPKQVELRAAKGKVVGLVFRFVGDQRSAPFLQGLDELYAGTDDVALAATHFLKGADNLDKQLEELLIELAQLEYRSAAGFDPDAEGKRIFRSFGANVGSATFFIVDTEGKLVWFQQDPRAIDVNLAKSIIERLRPSKPTTKKDED